MTFTKYDFVKEEIAVDYNDEWQFNDEEKIIDVKFYGFEGKLRKFCDLLDDYGDDWIDCYATIDPVNERVTKIYMVFTSNMDQSEVPDRDLLIELGSSDGKWMLETLLENDVTGGFKEFYEEAKRDYTNERREENE